jgi:hypothetical protein
VLNPAKNSSPSPPLAGERAGERWSHPFLSEVKYMAIQAICLKNCVREF